MFRSVTPAFVRSGTTWPSPFFSRIPLAADLACCPLASLTESLEQATNCLFIYLFILFIYLFIYLFYLLFIYLFIYLVIYLYTVKKFIRYNKFQKMSKNPKI